MMPVLGGIVDLPEGSKALQMEAGFMSRGQLYQVQQQQVTGPAHWSQKPCAMLQAWGRVAEKLQGGKGSGDIS